MITAALLLALAIGRPAPARGAGASAAAADSLPAWASARWEAAARAHTLVRSDRLTPAVLRGDFDHDGREDVAVFVVQGRTHKQGIVLLHARGGSAYLLGAGREFGNGGDSFEWMDEWHVEHRAGRADVLVIGREGSASARVEFRSGRYRWVQLGD